MGYAMYLNRYPIELNIAAAGTVVTGTLSVAVDVLDIRPAIAIWLDESDVSTAGNGLTLNTRVFVGADERRLLPWHSNTIAVINAVSGETGLVRAEGWVM